MVQLKEENRKWSQFSWNNKRQKYALSLKLHLHHCRMGKKNKWKEEHKDGLTEPFNLCFYSIF